jgi:hypothetical protein
MASREQLVEQITAVDREMNDLIAANPATQTTFSHTKFPWISWLICGAFTWSFMYGQGIVPISQDLWEYQAYVAGVFGILALVITVKWIGARGDQSGKAYREANEQLRVLRQKKETLQAELQSLNE